MYNYIHVHVNCSLDSDVEIEDLTAELNRVVSSPEVIDLTKEEEEEEGREGSGAPGDAGHVTLRGGAEEEEGSGEEAEEEVIYTSSRLESIVDPRYVHV